MTEEPKSSENQEDQETAEKDEDLVSHVVDSDSQSEVSREEELQAEVDRQKNDFLYLKAEFDNYKKRVIKERADLIKYGSERVFSELLEIVDNFERALSLEVNSENVESFSEGVQMIYNSLVETLKKLGVEEVPSEGQKFDPNVHEALSAEPTDKVEPGHISQVLKKPYKLHDRVIRPGQVVVARELDENKED